MNKKGKFSIINNSLLKPSSQLGFTLLEVMFAIVILSSALMLLANTWAVGGLKIRKAQTNFEVATLLERKMIDIDLEYRGKSVESIREETSPEAIGDEFPNYKWKMKSKKLEIPDISSTLTSKDGGANAFLISIVRQLTEALSKSVREVTVTIMLTTPQGKNREFSATTYFIDYDKDLQFGMPTGQ